MSFEDKEKINVVMMIEVIGKPPEHLVETLKDIIKNIGEEKGVKIIEEKIKEPTGLKDSKDFFTSFAEVEIEVEEMLVLVGLMFKYMPAHVEIVSPENIKMQNNDLGDTFNELLTKLHRYDEIARVLQVEKNILEKKLKALGGDKGK